MYFRFVIKIKSVFNYHQLIKERNGKRFINILFEFDPNITFDLS